LEKSDFFEEFLLGTAIARGGFGIIHEV
jgi:hypothetical protein